MHNHEPENYKCPMCSVAKSEENSYTYTRMRDVFYRDNYITAFIASHWWPNNKGHVIIIPNKHIENVYDISDELITKIYFLGRKVMIALKELYQCDGTSLRQHNEPAGNQDVWHFHLHIFPRYNADNLYLNDSHKALSDPEERIVFADKLKKYFKND